ncbi:MULTISPECIES: serine hydrolase [Actinokineospora]|uniref:Serine hydrolase n=1 Tax=Actinokineospora fastidiosa TaxID=1816 RepID=A0A918GL60_9PSEU|nr:MULTISPECIES: serine hydrolase [Actinokineospora]UVS77354.1 Beta-lactamase regulatory protein BlaB [Actinokineospora sp. UTMC 2448]GGS43936.1 serine hydrolase [Actinokineospora fastidiosa]
MIDDLRAELDDAGLRGSFLVRDLRSGEEIGIEPDRELPSASLVKVPLAIATLERVHAGELDGAAQLLVRPGRDRTPGLSQFRHPARIAVDDLVYLCVAISDGTAADALFELTPPERVTGLLRERGLRGITVRHPIQELSETPADRLPGPLAHSLAIGAGTAGGGHPVPQLDVTRGSSGTARAFVDLLAALWTPSRVTPEVAARVRELMGANVLRHRLAPDFTSDATTWSSKTGTLLNLRHEIGVVEHADGQAFAVAALTESRVPAAAQPGADAVMARVARALRDHLRF